MAADAWQIYDKFPLYMGNEVVDMDSDTFVVALFQSSSNCATLSLTALASFTNEASGGGYTRDTANSITWSESSGTVTFDITSDPTFTASGGSITARFAVIFDDTTTSPADTPVCVSLLDNTPANVTIASGTTLTLQINASGVFTIA